MKIHPLYLISALRHSIPLHHLTSADVQGEIKLISLSPNHICSDNSSKNCLFLI